MPDKRNDGKIMSMLERSGIIRKVGDGSPDEASSPYDSDIKPIFDTLDEPVKVTPAARQPVPGMPSPIFPSEESADTIEELPQTVDSVETESMQPLSTEPDPFAEPLAPPAAEEPSRPASTFGALNIFRNGSAPEGASALQPASDSERQPENYTERYLNINELYDALALRSKKTDTVYLIEEYLQTLPDSLPDSSRREIVNKIISASGFDYDLLMGDGVLRVKMLKEYAERFARHTDDYIAARQAELDEMDQRILRTRRLIENRKELHKKQFFTIEAEAQRLKEILTFISG